MRLGRMCTAITGANTTATSQERDSATAITANRVKVYSPAELAFREDGVKVTLALGQIDSKCETSRLTTDISYLQSTDDQV